MASTQIERIADSSPGGAGGSFGDAFPGEEPQAIEDRNQRLDTDTREAWPEPESYNFVYANGQFHISDSHDHSELAEHSGIQPEHTGPMAVGRVSLNMGKATFEIQANVSAQGLARVLKDYCKQVGWQWGGMVDLQGEPVGTGSEFAPVKSYQLHFASHSNELIISKSAGNASQNFLSEGTLHVDDFQGSAHLYGSIPHEAFEPLKEFCDDEGLVLFSQNDNVLKSIEDLEVNNTYSPEWNDAEDHFLEQDPPNERKPGGVYTCPNCNRIFPSWGIYLHHRKMEQIGDEDQTEDGKFPTLDMDATFPPHFDEMRQEPGIHTGTYDPNIPPEVTVTDPDAATWNDYNFMWRRPIVWHRDTNRVGIGHPGNYHGDVSQALGVYNNDRSSIHGWVSIPRDDGGQEFDQGNGPEYGLRMRTNNPASIPFIQKAILPYEPHAADIIEAPDYGALQDKDIWTSKVAAGTDPKDLIQAPIPFIYDVQNDTVSVGQAGQKQSDIPGKFTPGGIVEGVYEPGGSVLIRSMTNMPYSVRHLLELWTYQQPHMEITSINLTDDEGKRTKLAKIAAQDIGSYLRTLAAADPAVWRVYKALQGKGGTVYVVGGAVRDAIMGKEPNDLDLMVTGIPQEDVAHILAHLPGSVKATGSMNDGTDEEKLDTAHAFGVFHYHEGPHSVELALPRKEQSTGSGSKKFDKQVDPNMTPEEDLYRRDFTANAMAVNLTNGQLIDPFDGSSDVRKRVLRTLHTKSLGDDPLRTVRALTALSKHGLYPDDETKAQMQEYAPELTHLPQERIQKELDKLLAGDHPSEAIRLAQDTGTLPFILPEVSATYGWTQNNPHHELELFDHLLNVLDRTKERKPGDNDFALAGLLHDIGKKDSHWTECRDCHSNFSGHVLPCTNCGSQNTSGHFYKKRLEDGTTLGEDHETVGAELARARLNSLHYPKERINRVVDLIQHHMYSPFNTEKGARRFLRTVGDSADDLLHLRWADQGGKSEYPTDPSASTDNEMALINSARAQNAPTNKSMLAINGRDLIDAGIPPGPNMGLILNHLTDQVIDNPELNTKEALLGLAQTWKPPISQ